MSTFYLDSILSAEKRLQDPRNVAGVNYKSIGQGSHTNRGSSAGTERRNLSLETKGLVSALAQISGVKETSKALGLPPTVVGPLKDGKTSDRKYADPAVREQANSVLDTIGNKASNVLQNALEGLSSSDRINNAKTTELAQIASLMMGIVDKTRDKGNMFMAGRICFMVPPAREMSDFDVIDVVPTVE